MSGPLIFGSVASSAFPDDGFAAWALMRPLAHMRASFVVPAP